MKTICTTHIYFSTLPIPVCVFLCTYLHHIGVNHPVYLQLYLHYVQVNPFPHPTLTPLGLDTPWQQLITYTIREPWETWGSPSFDPFFFFSHYYYYYYYYYY